MQKAELVLMILKDKSKENQNYKFQRLYRHLFNKEFYLRAYSKIYNKEGNMTKGTDEITIDGFSYEKIEKLIEALKKETYYPKPVRRVYIPKKNGKKRPLGIPNFYDKLIQEIIREILEAIYEPEFNDNSHGFRPNRSCHTALYQIKTTCKGANWVIEGDIESFFDNINHEVIIKILSNKIDDGRFIELIKKFLKAGYMEEKKKYETWSGTPQGGIISPILANIYLNEFDDYMDDIIKNNTCGVERRTNPKYNHFNVKRCLLRKKGNYEEADKCLKELRKIYRMDMMDENYKRIKYVRYADDFLIFIWGSKELALNIKEEISDFLTKNLKIKLSGEKTLITNLSDRRVKFLGYEITKSRENSKITKVNGIGKRMANGTIQLLVPNNVMKEKIKPFVANGKSVHHNARVNLPVLDIISQYNYEIRGIYNYYCLATDVSTKVGEYKFYHYYSLIKTIARKEKSSVKKIIDKYGIELKRKDGTGTRKVIGIKYETKEGIHTLTYFNESLSKKDKPLTKLNDVMYEVKEGKSQLINRINANQCEMCGKTGKTSDFEVHHIRKLKDVKNKYGKRGNKIPNWVLQMCRMNRKTLILCKKCHVNLHNGSL